MLSKISWGGKGVKWQTNWGEQLPSDNYISVQLINQQSQDWITLNTLTKTIFYNPSSVEWDTTTNNAPQSSYCRLAIRLGAWYRLLWALNAENKGQKERKIEWYGRHWSTSYWVSDTLEQGVFFEGSPADRIDVTHPGPKSTIPFLESKWVWKIPQGGSLQIDAANNPLAVGIPKLSAKLSVADSKSTTPHRNTHAAQRG